MSSFFAFGLRAGKPIGDLTKAQLIAGGHAERVVLQNLPVLVIVLWGGFITNFIWSWILIIKNGSAMQFFGTPGMNPMRATHSSGTTMADFDPEDPEYSEKLSVTTLFFNYIFAVMAGVIWYFQFFFYSMGTTKMGKYDFSSWTLHMASIIIFATLWGIFLKEWKGTSGRTKGLVTAGLALLISSTVVVGYGNYLAAVLKK
jgi:L-rhamnose-H+ transport protein